MNTYSIQAGEEICCKIKASVRITPRSMVKVGQVNRQSISPIEVFVREK